MRATTLAALLALAAATPAVASDVLLAPADPALGTRWHSPPSPMRGSKTYRPVEARSDWGAAPGRTPPEPSGHGAGTGMPGMKGMSMPGMDMGGGR